VTPALMNIPRTEEDWNRWAFDNRDSHDRIRAAIALAGGPLLADYQLDPFPQDDVPGWLQRHQQTHIEMTGVLHIQSNDLQDVDLTDENQRAAWIQIHLLEHMAVEDALKI
jgi:hypothetical protein